MNEMVPGHAMHKILLYVYPSLALSQWPQLGSPRLENRGERSQAVVAAVCEASKDAPSSLADKVPS